MPKQPTPFELILCKIILGTKQKGSKYAIKEIVHLKEGIKCYGTIKYPGGTALFSLDQIVGATEILEEQINSQK